jgi:hypothetical protein
MNQFLAEMYGTRETIGAPAQSDDTEKLAEAQLLDDALRSEGIDVDTLSPEAILKVAQSLFPEGALVKAAAEEGHEEDETEAKEKEEEAAKDKEGEGETTEEKTAQADFLGRVMAHAFVQEQDAINKEAALKDIAGKAKEYGVKAWGATKGGAGKAWGAAKKGGEALKEKGKAMKESYREGSTAAPMLAIKGGKLRGLKQVAKEHPKTIGGAAAGLAAASGGAGYLAHKKKEGSALDKLAEQRALEILAENGYGQDGDEKLASAVEQRAWEMLAENGYVSEE